MRSVFLLLAVAILVGLSPVSGDTFTVTSTADSGVGTLRQAIIDANGSLGNDTIEFAIPQGECSAAGICTIELASIPDEITEGVVIDGTTQPRYGTAPANVCATETAPSYMRIEVLGLPGFGDYTFKISSASPSSLRGMAMNRGYPVNLQSAGAHRVQCNHIGVSADGTTEVSTSWGVVVDAAANGALLGVDGDGVEDLGERNVFAAGTGIYINGNDNNVVAGNFFGLGADGVSPLGTSGAVYIRQSSSNNLVGTNEDGVSDDLERNLIANCSTGVGIDSNAGSGDGNLVVGNRFGLDAEGGMASNFTAIRLSSGGVDHEIRNNEIFWNSIGVKIEESAAMGVASTGNCVVGNVDGVIHEGTAATWLEHSWWGSGDGPAGDGPGSGDTVSVTDSGSLDFDPWLTVVPTRCSIFADGFESGDTSAWSATTP